METRSRSSAESLTHLPFAAAVVLAAAFLAALPSHPYPGSWLLKASPLLLLCGLSWTRLQPKLRTLMAASFLFSAAGDVFLDVDRARLFVPGLGSFLVAHVLYVLAFWNRRQWTTARGLGAAAAFAFSGTMLSILLPHLGPLTVPVAAYVVVLTAMGASAVLIRRTSQLTPVGAILFMASDSMIAIHKFLMPSDAFAPWIWATYAAGQLLIYKGLEKDYAR